MHRVGWSSAEKKVARVAFNAALACECAAIRREVEAMLQRSSDPAEIWRVHDYLSRKRREIDDKYDYRYSVLMTVFSRLFAEGWLNEGEIAALTPEKVEWIKRSASVRRAD